jgi:hypothetical protein
VIPEWVSYTSGIVCEDCYTLFYYCNEYPEEPACSFDNPYLLACGAVCI